MLTAQSLQSALLAVRTSSCDSKARLTVASNMPNFASNMVDGTDDTCINGRSTEDQDFYFQVYGSDQECGNLYVGYGDSINSAGNIRVVIMDFEGMYEPVVLSESSLRTAVWQIWWPAGTRFVVSMA